jgi:hypothetical protein
MSSSVPAEDARSFQFFRSASKLDLRNRNLLEDEFSQANKHHIAAAELSKLSGMTGPGDPIVAVTRGKSVAVGAWVWGLDWRWAGRASVGGRGWVVVLAAEAS